MSNKSKDKTIDDVKEYISTYNLKGLKDSIIINANQMINLNGKIDTFKLIDKFVVDTKPIYQLKDDEGNILNNGKDNKYWIQVAEHYIIYLKRCLDEDISNISADDLKQKVIDFNLEFLNKFIGGIKYNLRDLIGTSSIYANHLASALVDLQVIEINNIGLDKFLKLDLDIQDASFKMYIRAELLKATQTQLNSIDDIDKIDTSDLDDVVRNLLYTNQILDSIEQVEKIIRDNQAFYDRVHNLYEDINKLIDDVGKKYKAKDDELSKEDIKKSKSKKSKSKSEQIDTSDVSSYEVVNTPTDKKTKPYYLTASKLFEGNIIALNKPYNLNNYDRHKDPINIIISINEDKLKDFSSLPILADLYNNDNKIALLPIDLPLFLSFTKLNSENGGNKPITLEDAFNNIVEDKGVRLRKSNKSYDIYQERLLYLDRLNMVFSIVDAKTKDNIYTLKDPTPLLANSRVLLNSNRKTAYIIGASAIITLINALNKIYGVDFMASYNIDKKYINDNQANTIEILNMKYYILPKILQYGNSKKRIDVAQNKINLDDLYTSTAILKGKKELSKKDKETLKGQINTYLNHLTNKNLIRDYSYASDKTQNLSVDVLKTTKQRDIKYLKIK